MKEQCLLWKINCVIVLSNTTINNGYCMKEKAYFYLKFCKIIICWKLRKMFKLSFVRFKKWSWCLKTFFSRDELLHSNPKDLVSMQQKIVQRSAWPRWIRFAFSYIIVWHIATAQQYLMNLFEDSYQKRVQINISRLHVARIQMYLCFSFLLGWNFHFHISNSAVTKDFILQRGLQNTIGDRFVFNQFAQYCGHISNLK